MISLGPLDLESILGSCGLIACNYDKNGDWMADSNNSPEFDLKARDKDGDSCLHLLLVSEHEVDTITQILHCIPKNEMNDLINAKNNLGQTPLHLSIIEGKDDIVNTLIGYGANAAVPNNENETSFHLATKLGKNKCLRAIIPNADPSTLDVRCTSGESALHFAIKGENMEALDLLLDKGVNVNLKNEKTGETALHYAVKWKNEVMIKKLLSLGADVKAKTGTGYTPLHLINSAADRHIAQLLLEKGADINVENNEKKSPHDLADKTLKRFMVRNRKDRRTRRRKGQTEATRQGSKDGLKSNAKTEQCSDDDGQSATVFLPIGTVLEAKANKIPRQVNGVMETGTRCYNAVSGNENRFQPELFQELLRESLLDHDQTNRSDGTIDVTSQILNVSGKKQLYPWLTDSPTSSDGVSYTNFDGSTSIDACGSSFSESEEAASTLSLNLTGQDTTAQYSSPTILLTHQISTGAVQSQHPSFSPLPIQSLHQTSANIYSTQKLLQQTSVTSPAGNTANVPQGTPSPSTMMNAGILPPQQKFVDTSRIQETPLFEVAPQQTIAGPSVLQDTVTGSSSLQYVDDSSSNSTLNYDSIDSALQAAGLVDSESRSLAKEMPSVIQKIEELANRIGLRPADLVNRIFSYPSS